MGGAIVRDVVIGMSDGLTVPFALAAGLSGAATASRVVVTAGCAEIAAGAIAMGLGGYLAARNDAQHYASEHRREALKVAAGLGSEEAFDAGLAEEQALEGVLPRLSRERATELASECIELYMWDRLGCDN